jgi:hypothetical protein
VNRVCEMCGRLINSPKICKLCLKAKLGENMRKAQAERTGRARLGFKKYDARRKPDTKRRADRREFNRKRYAASIGILATN